MRRVAGAAIFAEGVCPALLALFAAEKSQSDPACWCVVGSRSRMRDDGTWTWGACCVICGCGACASVSQVWLHLAVPSLVQAPADGVWAGKRHCRVGRSASGLGLVSCDVCRSSLVARRRDRTSTQ
eukprot:7381155-Prymnesium_polylepis.1